MAYPEELAKWIDQRHCAGRPRRMEETPPLPSTFAYRNTK
ncbi:hypothetical protein PAMC26510_07330 [Caballeronia sordidicola]|uniref:Uncharacterized protein n=1 Tax=Caballeronia sordidicola TaxID=196367 RepID=A0A242N4B2_CABSO|nr:hypothetical protein PAMC26510_07330 [Caballeronia sordidicola]